MLRHDQALKQGWMKWRGLVSEQARSGQSVKAFCREHGLCRPYFFVWKKRLEEVQVAGYGPSTPGDSSVEIRLRNGRSLMVRPGFDAEHVRALGKSALTGGPNLEGTNIGSCIDTSHVTHGFVLKEGEFTSFDFPGVTFTDAPGINPGGVIVGLFDAAAPIATGWSEPVPGRV
jgi:hypothetical protein